MCIETTQDMHGLLRIGRFVALTLQEMEAQLRPGMTTKQLDMIGGKVLRQHHARSAPILTYNFPGVTRISINDEAAHGIPGKRVIQPSDVVKIDVSAALDGYFADAAITVLVPPSMPSTSASTPVPKQRLRRRRQPHVPTRRSMQWDALLSRPRGNVATPLCMDYQGMAWDVPSTNGRPCPTFTAARHGSDSPKAK